MQNYKAQPDVSTETPDNEEQIGAHSVLLNWMDVNQKREKRKPLHRPRTMQSSLGKRFRSFRIPGFKFHFPSRRWIVSSGILLGSALVLFLIFRPAGTANTLLEESHPEFDDVIFHPLDEQDQSIPGGSNLSSASSSDSSLHQFHASPELKSPGASPQSSSSIQTADFTTENSSTGPQGAWLTGTIETEETAPPQPLPYPTQIGRRVEYFTHGRN